MTFTISKKDLALYATIVILIVTLAGTWLVYKAQAQDANDASKVQVETNAMPNEENISAEESTQGVPSGYTIPHMSCGTEIVYGNLPTSQTYNSDTPYNLSAFASGVHFQDMNGDNLPDYIYISHNVTGFENALNSTYKGCVLLNNGNGWTRVHVCQADTNQNLETGEFTRHEYRGDCAGAPAANGNGNTDEDNE